MRITEDYFIGDLPLAVRTKASRSSNNRLVRPSQQPTGHVYQRRTSCPGFQSAASSSVSDGVAVEVGPMSQTANDAARRAHSPLSPLLLHTASQKKKKQVNPRRSLRRYLTADSALLLTDNGRIEQRQLPYHPQAIQLWTTSLMAEFNHIIDGELERLAGSANTVTASASNAATNNKESSLSPWAQMQLALIDPVRSSDKSSEVIQQLSADIELVERQIFHDLNDLNSSGSSSFRLASDPPVDGEPSTLLVSVSFFSKFRIISRTRMNHTWWRWPCMGLADVVAIYGGHQPGCHISFLI